MGIFFLLFTYMFLVYLSTNRLTKRNRLLCTFLCVLGAWLVMALRSPWCGVDLYRGAGEVSYYWVFEKVKDYNLLDIYALQSRTSQEVGWVVYNKLVSLICSDFQFFLAFTALLIVGIVGFVIYIYSSNIYMSILVYCTFGLYHFCFSGLRQGLAISLTFLSYFFLERKKFFWFVIIVLLASTMHSSALIFLIAYPLSKINYSPQKSLLLLIGVFCLLPFLSPIVQVLTSVLFPGKYHYENEGGAITMFLVYTVIYILTLRLKSEYSNKLRGVILFAVLGQSLGTISTTSMTRIGYYFTIFFALLIPELANSFFVKKNKIFGTFVISILFILFFYLTVKDGYLNVVPYYFFWEKPI